MSWSLMETWETITAFVASGGPVMLAIAVLTFVMWTIIFERLWFLKGSLRKTVKQNIDSWDARTERKSWNAHQIRNGMISRVNEDINLNLDLVGAMTALCPLFGLLGTVYGMIEVFDVLSITGGTDPKSMASGVKQATIPTMAGMVAAISGVFGGTFINQIAQRESKLHEDHLTMDH
jgi:biopolymer transport protein ExbB